MKFLSQLVSWIFLPLFMPVYALLMVMYIPSNLVYCFDVDCMYTLPEISKYRLLLEFGALTAVFPGLSLVIMHRYGMVSTIEIDERRERRMPILLMLLYGVLLFVAMKYQTSAAENFPKYILSLPLSGSITIFIFFFLNEWRKVSMHAAGVGIFTGFLLAYVAGHADHHLWFIQLAVLVSGAVISARLYLEKHTLIEVVVGWFLATFVTFAVNYWYP